MIGEDLKKKRGKQGWQAKPSIEEGRMMCTHLPRV